MAASERANPTAGPGLGVSGRAPSRVGAAEAVESRLGLGRVSVYGWSAIAAATAFIAVTCWWLTQDRSIPIYDAGDQLYTALEYHAMLQAGNLLGPFTHESVYPILGHMVGALAAFVGGVNVASPIVGENLVFVPLLALGCYQTGRLLFGGLAGALAVVFALSSTLLISLFHVFMLDGPLTALVALSVWLVLASEDFKRAGVSAAAGLAVGLGLNMKAQFALFLAGLVAVVVLHGGWRNRRGLSLFLAVAGVVGLPWYAVHFSELGKMLELASAGPGTPPSNIPPRFSTDNLMWYFWDVLNGQLLAPLFLLACAGAVWTTVTVARERARNAARLEFLLGGFLAWLVITFVTIHHDIRYGLPLLGYLSVIGTGWIAHVSRVPRTIALAVLAIGAVGSVLANDLGVGREVQILPNSGEAPEEVVLYKTTGFLAGAPQRDGDVPGLLEALHREGVDSVLVDFEQAEGTDFSWEGLLPLGQITKLKVLIAPRLEYGRSATFATLVHLPVSAGTPPPCTRLSDGTGVWVIRYDAAVRQFASYCPSRRPQYYAVGVLI